MWRDWLHMLPNAEIPRCYNPEKFGDVKKVELFHFSDASEEGQGQCKYIRVIEGAGYIRCTVPMAK